MFKKIFGLISVIFIMFVLVSCTNRTVELTFNTNEGTSVETIVIDQGSLVEIPTTSKEGYTFQGWYENSNFDESSKFLFDVPVVRNMTFYAKWSINSYQMVFFPDNDTSIPSREYVYQGDVILPTPTKEGYEFVGWFEGSIDGTRFDLDKMPARNVNLYAKWSIYSYTITFLIDDVVFETKTVTHGGTLTDIPVPPSITGKVRYWDHTDFTNITSDMEVNLIEDDAYYQVVVKDTFGTVYETLTIKHGDPFIPTVTPSKEGYLFVGYNPGINHIITSNLDVMVIYEQITFLVIFRNEQGTPIKEVNIALGEDAVPPTYLAPNGYDFSGWSKSFENVTENLTIDPILTPKTYEVKLNANGGLFEGQQNEFVISAEYLSIIGLPPTPTKEGYQFGGWFDNIEGTGTVYTFSPSTVMPLEGLELFAKWSVRNYSLTYSNLNGTTHSNPTSYTILSNTITLNAPTNRTGYQFIGWFDALTGGNQVTEITLGSTGNKTLYARFSPITYSITYNNLEGTTHSNPETYNIETPTINLENPTSRTGYNFVGWFTALSGGNEVTEITLGSTGNKTLYARFTAKTYTLTYNLNGGTGPSTLSVTYDQGFTLGTASKTGYQFTGWTYSGNPFTSGTWLIDGDVTIDAVFSPITYTITYSNLEGTTHTNPENYTIETTTITLLDPTNRMGYNFIGWFDTLNGGNQVTEITLGSTGNKTLYARFTAKTYTITYNLNGGTGPSTLSVTYNQSFTLGTASKTGYQFTGWTYLGNPFISGTWLIDGDITIDAVYSPVNYTITYNNLEGTTHENPNTYTIETENIFLEEPTNRTGYQFIGWFNQSTSGEEISTISLGSTGNIDLYARFEPITYDITYSDLQGTTHSNPSTYHIETNSFSLTNPTSRIGYQFIGWFDALTDGNQIVSIPKGSFGDLEIFARFTPISYTINYQDLFGTTHLNPVNYTIETTTITLLEPTDKTGYDFVGWFTHQIGGNEVISIPQGSTGNKTLYARFTPTTYNITYNNLEGTTHSNPESYNIETATITLLDPTDRAGYNFVGWFDALTGGVVVTEIESGSIEDLELYARFIPITYIVTYGNLQGTTHSNPESYNIETATITLLDPTERTGYTFIGWFDALSGGNKVTEITLGTTGDLELYARFTVKSYTLTYNLNGGTGPSTLSVTYNQSFTLGVANKTGYEFTGWTYLGNPFISGTWLIDSDVTIDAVYTPITYNITYNNLNGTTHANPLTYTIETATITLLDPTNRIGYNFVGWFSALNGGTEVETIQIGSTGNKTVYARFSPITYSITYSNLEGTTHSNPNTYTIETATITLLDPTNRTGYNFVGWFDALTGGNEVTEIVLGSTGTLDVFARFSPITYSITYNNLEGTTHSNPETYNIETPTINLTNPTSRTGYNFVGWFTALNGGNEVTEITLGTTGNKTLYARFTAKTYTLTYNLNGGTGSSTLAVTYNESFTLGAASKTGYEFIGWTYLGNPFTSGTWSIDGDITIDAVYNPITYTITYSNQQGTTHSNPTTYTIETSTITLLDPTSRTGYYFVGWFDALTGGNEVTEIIEGSTGNQTLYARFTAKTYNITYNLNGGTGPSTLNVTYNQSFTLGVATKDEFTFAGWLYQGLPFTSGTWLIDSDITIDAQWTEWPVITFEVFGGSGVSQIFEAPGTLITAPNNPLKSGYVFEYWYESDDSIPYVFDAMPATDLTLYAKYSIEIFNVSYENLEGTTHTNPDTYTIETATIILLDPTSRIGYNFVGWFDALTGGNEVTEITLGSTGNLTLYARFTAKTYTLTYNLNGGTGPTTLNVTYNESFTLSTASKTGYDFTGWTYLGDAFTSGTWSIDGDITIDAVYSLITYTITYNNLELTTHSNPDTYTIATSTITLLDSTYRTGYNFVGWFDALNGGNEVTAITLGSTGDLELFARFTAKSYTVTYNLNGGTGPTTLNVTYNESFTLGTASKLGYEFTGWTYLGDAFTSGTWSIDGDITIDAVYNPITYTITYNNLEGTTHTNPDTYTIETSTITLLDPTNRLGYNFVGWFDELNDGFEVTEIELGSIGDVELYARFTPIIYSITYSNLQGTTHSNPDNYNIETSTITLLDPTNRLGYNFVGWFDALTGGNEITKITLGSTGNIEVFARFEAITYSITYSNLQGTTQTNPDTYTIETPTITLLDPTSRTGYNFTGWYTALSGGTKVETIPLGSVNNLELYARFTPKTYTLTYNLNGGTGPSTLTVTYNQAYTLGTSDKVGYTFTGWEYDGSPFTSGTWTRDSNLTINATYTTLNYNIIYNDLAGTTHDNPSAYTIETPTFNLNSPTNRLGYNFVGWFNASSGGTLVTEITLGSTGKKILYARFEAITYNLTYSNLQGTTQSNPNTYTIETSTITLLDPTSRTGYNFVGWFDALTDGFEVTEIILGSTGNIEVFARFEPISYSITYNNLLGTTHSNPLNYHIESETFILTDPTYRIGYEFVGWFDALTGGNEVTEIIEGSTGNLTLYARFTAKTYTITYNLNGGTGPTTLNVTYNESFTLSTASKTGYDFTGWTYLGDAFTSGTWSIDGDITIDAVYSPITYTITYNNLEGTTHSNPDTYTIETSTITLLDPTYRTGYNFVGWFDALNGGNEVTAITLGSTGDLELFARFTAKSYTVTYNLNGGTGPTTLNVTYNESFTLGVASKTGYEFTGWTYLGDEFVSGTWSIDSNITIEATYEALIYEIDYQNLLGTTHSNPENYTIETATITLLDPTNKAGYNFVGWFDALNGGNEVTEITLGSIGNLTLYARFEAITYTVTYLNLFDMIHDNDLIITIESEFILTDPSIRTGYRFLGWFTELESGNRILEISAGNLTGMTLYARWEIAYYDVAGSYVYERLDISENQTEILQTVTNEGSQSFSIPSLLHGTDILPIIEIEGYMFNRLVYNGITYDDIEHLITVVDHIDLENLTIYYRRLILEVVFIQNDAASPPGSQTINYETSIRYTYYNLGVDNLYIPALYTYTDITSLWERSTISQVQSTMTISALYFNTTTKTIRFKDGSSIIFIASELGLTPQTEFISVDALIWNLTKPGYRFLGWFYMDGQTEKKLTPGSYVFEVFNANQTEIYTKWQQLTAFNQVTNVLVTINGTDDITITWNLDLNGLTNPSFDIYIDQEKVVGYQSIIQQSGNLFTLNIPTSAIDYDLFEKLIEVGMHRVTVQAVGDNVNHMTGLMSEAYIYEVKSIYDENPSNVDTYDYFIVEDYQGTLRYIFYTNMTYQFNSGYQFEIITGSDLVTLNNPYTMKMNQISGQFRFKMTRPDQSFNIYDGLVVKDIKGFSFGTNYQQYLDETGVQSSYVDQSDPYIVGTKNSFYLDLRMTSSTGNRIRLDDALLSYEFYLYNGSTYNLIAANDLSNHVDLLPNNRLQFKTGTEGNMYQVKVSPKYQSTRMTVSELTFEFVVNAGYNAFTHQDLKEFFSDDSVDLINLHANIQPVLSPNQLNSDGSPKNVKNGLGNVYNRNLTSTNNNEVRIEGNFMVINGSNLPYSNARSGSGLVGFAEAFEIVNVQIAIFNYNMTGTEPNTNKFTMNNLTIIGNTTVPSVNFGGTSEEILLQERLMSRNSGGYIGVMVNNGSSEFNNIQIRFAVIGISHYAYGEDVEMIVDQSIIKDSWANSMYMQGATKLTVTNSIYGQSGGSAFHLSDSRAGGGINNPTLIIDNTVIENFISGEEAWFKAYGMTSVALQLKSGISQGIQSTGRTIIDMVTHPVTGVQTEMINFILLTEPHTGAEVRDGSSNIIGGSEVSVTINGKTTNRPYDYLSGSGDPRIQGGQFAYPMSLYSDQAAFMALITDIITIGAQNDQTISLQDASNLAFLGGFYNLTANELLAFATNQQTVEQILTSSPRAIPNYLEVLAPIPVFPTGYAVVIIELQKI